MRSPFVTLVACLFVTGFVACENEPLVTNGGQGGAGAGGAATGSSNGGASGPPSAGSGNGGAASAAVNQQDTGTGGSGGAQQIVIVVDAGSATPTTPATDGGAAEHRQTISCAELAAGGKPTQLRDFQWQYKVGPLDSNNWPYDTVAIAHDCDLVYQKTNPPLDAPPVMRTSTTRNVTMNPTDCTAARSWATNARFLSVLDTGDGCPYGPGNHDDLFESDLIDGTSHRRKTYLCPEPTLDAVRACVSDLATRLFP